MKRFYLLLCSICLCIPLLSNAQFFNSVGFLNTGGGIDHKRMNFGFLLGVDNNSFRVVAQPGYTQPDANPYTDDVLNAIKTTPSLGFSMGIVTNFKLAPLWDIRFLPTFSFANMQLQYNYTLAGGGQESIHKKVESTLVQLPLMLKFKSDRYKDVRLYVTGGVVYSIDLRSEKKKPDDSLYEPTDDRTLVKINDSYGSYKIGIGADLYLAYFKLSPEISITRGFGNILSNAGANKFTQPLSKLYAQTVSITFYFE